MQSAQTFDVPEKYAIETEVNKGKRYKRKVEKQKILVQF